GAGYFFLGDRGERDGRGWLGFLRGIRILEGSYLHDFLGNSFLLAVLAALEVPSLLKNLFKGFLAVRKGDPGVTVPSRTPEPDSEVARHKSSLRILMIPVCRESGCGPPGAFLERETGLSALVLRAVTFAGL